MISVDTNNFGDVWSWDCKNSWAYIFNSGTDIMLILPSSSVSAVGFLLVMFTDTSTFMHIFQFLWFLCWIGYYFNMWNLPCVCLAKTTIFLLLQWAAAGSDKKEYFPAASDHLLPKWSRFSATGWTFIKAISWVEL